MIPAADRAGRGGSPAATGGTRPMAGPALSAISLIHLASTPIFHGPALAAIIDDGIVNAIESGSTLLDARDAAFWYVAAGLGMVLLGQLAWWAERRVGVLPVALGWPLIAFTIINVLLVPVSGFWLFILPAAVVLVRAHRLRIPPPPSPWRRDPQPRGTSKIVII